MARATKYNRGEAYVLHFDRFNLVDDDQDPSWTLNHNRFIELLKGRSKETPTLFAICDYSARTGRYREDPRISFFQMGAQITSDLLEREKFMSEKCFARCSLDTFETNDIKKQSSDGS